MNQTEKKACYLHPSTVEQFVPSFLGKGEAICWFDDPVHGSNLCFSTNLFGQSSKVQGKRSPLSACLRASCNHGVEGHHILIQSRKDSQGLVGSFADVLAKCLTFLLSFNQVSSKF